MHKGQWCLNIIFSPGIYSRDQIAMRLCRGLCRVEKECPVVYTDRADYHRQLLAPHTEVNKNWKKRVLMTQVPVMTEPRPAKTAVLCKQLPTAIQRAVSSPSLTGSITITGTAASSARSSSSSNLCFKLSTKLSHKLAHLFKLRTFPEHFRHRKFL